MASYLYLAAARAALAPYRRCPGCGGRVRVAREAAQKAVVCPRCGRTVPLRDPSTSHLRTPRRVRR
jgi:uncharacterized paraquat-inducible protein A